MASTNQSKMAKVHHDTNETQQQQQQQQLQQYAYLPGIELNHKYVVMNLIGEGAFAQVFQARNRENPSQLVAIKRMRVMHQYHPMVIKSARREVDHLRELKHENIVNLIEICPSYWYCSNIASFYLIFEYCPCDLAGLLCSEHGKFTLAEVKSLAQQILLGLQYLHHQGFIHRDLKAQNILVTNLGVVKLADFGMSRKLEIDPLKQNYTPGLMTLWYRAPEVLLGGTQYDTAVDMWSVGIVIAEIFKRKPLIQSYSEHVHLASLTQLCGSITAKNWPTVLQLPMAKSMLNNLPEDQPRQLKETLYPVVKSYLAIDLIDWMLQWNPSSRICTTRALSHTFFRSHPRPANLKSKFIQMNLASQ